MAGVTLDTGVFIGLERRERRALALWSEWTRTAVTLTVIAEWWRDRQWDAARWLGGVDVEPVDEALARVSGEVLGELRLGREHTIDAIVMASAAQRGDTLYTSDFDDMVRLATRFWRSRAASLVAYTLVSFQSGDASGLNTALCARVELRVDAPVGCRLSC